MTNPLRSEIFAAYGALPGPLPISELYGGLRQAVFDAQENPIPTIFGDRFYEVQSQINLTGHVWSYNIIAANSEFLDSMSEEHQAIFDETLDEAVEWLNEAVASDIEATALVAFVVMMLVTPLQVLNRFVLHIPMPWTEDLARILFVASMMVGIALATCRGEHITVDFLLSGVRINPGGRVDAIRPAGRSARRKRVAH